LSIKYRLNLIVADGSYNCQSHIFNLLETKHNLNFIKFPFDQELIDFYKKTYKALCLIKSKYSCLIDTDEFINFENVEYIINYLDKNDKYVLMRGKIINFELNKQNEIDIMGPQYNKNEYTNLDKDLVFKKISYWEGIHKTDSIKEIFRTVVDHKINDVYSFLDITTIIGQINGYLINDNSLLFSFRQSNTSYFDEKEDRKNSFSYQMNFTLKFKIIEILNFIKLFFCILFKKKIKLAHILNLIKYFITVKIYHQFKNSFKRYLYILKRKMNYISQKNMRTNNKIDNLYKLSPDEVEFFSKNKKYLNL